MVLQAQAQTTKWVTMTLVVSCVGVMGVTGIVMGVYLSGNLGKGDDSDDIVSIFNLIQNFYDFKKKRTKKFTNSMKATLCFVFSHVLTKEYYY